MAFGREDIRTWIKSFEDCKYLRDIHADRCPHSSYWAGYYPHPRYDGCRTTCCAYESGFASSAHPFEYKFFQQFLLFAWSHVKWTCGICCLPLEKPHPSAWRDPRFSFHGLFHSLQQGRVLPTVSSFLLWLASTVRLDGVYACLWMVCSSCQGRDCSDIGTAVMQKQFTAIRNWSDIVVPRRDGVKNRRLTHFV